MSTQSIQSQDIKIAEVYQGFYSVPDYQREYVWQSKQVEQLLTDIYSELNGSDPDKAPEYGSSRLRVGDYRASTSTIDCPGGLKRALWGAGKPL